MRSNQIKQSCTHLNPKHFYLEVVDFLRSTRRPDILRLCGHADVNGNLKVVLFLTDKGLVSGRIVEAFICIDMVGGRGPETQKESLLKTMLQVERVAVTSPQLLIRNMHLFTHSVWKLLSYKVLHCPGMYCSQVNSWKDPSPPAPAQFPELQP